MPNERQIALTPAPVVPTEVPIESRVASDIANVLGGVAGALTTGIGAIGQQVEQSNQDVQMYMKYVDAANEARTRLGIAKSRQTIDENQMAMQQAETIQTYYNKLKAQERTGLLSSVMGRNREELVRMLSANPASLDPENILDYRNEVAKRLAFQDSAFIFNQIQQDANRIDAPQQTISQHVDNIVATRKFATEEQQRAYLETLLPAVANTNEQLMQQAWTRDRENVAGTLSDELRLEAVTQVNSGNFDSKKFFGVFNDYTERAARLFPEQSRARIEATVMQTLGDTLYGEQSLVDPYAAQRAIDSLRDDPQVSKNSRYKQFVEAANYNVTQRVAKFENNLLANANENIKSIQDYGALLGLQTTYDSELKNQNISQNVYDTLTSSIATQKNVLSTATNQSLSQELDQLRDTRSFREYARRLEAARPLIGDRNFSLLMSRLETRRNEANPYVEVADRMSPNLSTQATSGMMFGPKHDPAIDDVYRSMITTQIAPDVAYATIYERFGRITPTMIANLNTQAETGSVESLQNAMSIVAALPSNAVDVLVNTNISGQQLSPKLRALMVNQMANGQVPADLIASVANVPNRVFEQAHDALIKGDGGLAGSRAVINSALGSGMLFWASTPNPSRSMNDETRELYALRYAQEYSNATGDDPKAIAARAMTSTKRDLQARYEVMEFGNETLAFRRLSRTGFTTEDARALNELVALGKQQIVTERSINAEDLRVDMDRIAIVQGGETQTVPTYIIPLINSSTGSLRTVATIEIPQSDVAEYRRMIVEPGMIANIQLPATIAPSLVSPPNVQAENVAQQRERSRAARREIAQTIVKYAQ
jgi:hypothetical protein